jgi:hypothetical protein
MTGQLEPGPDRDDDDGEDQTTGKGCAGWTVGAMDDDNTGIGGETFTGEWGTA